MLHGDLGLANVSLGDDGTVRLWDASSGAELAVFTGHVGRVFAVTFSPDGERIAFASFRDGLWNVEWVKHRARERRFVTSNERRGVYLRYPAFSPDSAWVRLCGSNYG